MTLLALCVLSYLLGAIPFGVIVARAKGIDIMSVGSGNIGATNVIRAAGWQMGLVVFVLDILKGLAPAAAARSILASPVAGLDSQVVWLIVGFMAVLGHSFSPFIRFKGGKGISTALGAGLGAAPVVALSSFGVFSLVLAASRFVGLSSIIAAFSSVMFAAFLPGESRQLVPLFAVLWLLIVWRHRKNLRRMREGTEPKFTFRRTIPPPAPDSGLKEAPRQIG